MNKAVQLLVAYDEFERRHPNADLTDFCSHYLRKNEVKKEKNSRGQLLRIIGRLSSAYAFYHRAAMQKTKLPSPEGFYFLNGLAHLGETRKTALINHLFMEYTTGIEAINKLVKAKLVKEKSDPLDKRARIISLTDKGSIVLNECYQYAGKVTDIVLRDLSDEDVLLVVSLLQVLEEKHTIILSEAKAMDFDEMYKSYLDR